MGVPLVKYFSLLRTYLKPYKTQTILLSITMVTSIVISIVNPQIIKFYIDSIKGKTEIQTLQQAAILYIGLAVVQQTIGIASVFLSQKVSWGSTNLLRSEVLTHAMNLDMTFHNQYKPGDLIERVDGDVNALSNFFSRLVLQLVSNMLYLVGILLAIYLENLILGLVFTVFSLIGLVITYYIRRFVVPYFKRMREASMELMGFLEEHLQGTEDIQALGMTEYVKEKHYANESKYYHHTIKAIVFSRLINLTYNGLIAFGTTFVYVVGVPIHLRGGITLGSLFLINYYVSLLVQPIFVILSQIQTLQQADASIERIDELLNMESKIYDNGVLPVPDKQLDMEFRDVTFAYHEGTNVLENLSFLIPAGKTVGLIGRTGSGKTTISRLIYRFYEPLSGQILLDGREIREYQLRELRRNIGVVTQDVQIFQATVRQNLTFFDESFDDEEVLSIIHNVGLTEWYTEQENGLDTRISESQLSAGQAQLLSVGRLFLKNPKIVILDEASSRLDPVTENYLDQAVMKLLEGRTALIIAHRLSTLDKADYILNIEFGKLIEFGRREELLKNPNSKYAKLRASGTEVVAI